jgi:hypothetical protein
MLGGFMLCGRAFLHRYRERLDGLGGTQCHLRSKVGEGVNFSHNMSKSRGPRQAWINDVVAASSSMCWGEAVAHHIRPGDVFADGAQGSGRRARIVLRLRRIASVKSAQRNRLVSSVCADRILAGSGLFVVLRNGLGVSGRRGSVGGSR